MDVKFNRIIKFNREITINYIKKVLLNNFIRN